MFIGNSNFDFFQRGEFMLFSVGYQLRVDDSLIDAVLKNKNKIREIYFSWEDFPNGRNTLSNSDFSIYESREKRDEDFKRLFDEGIAFNLLLNGNCYGKDAQSRSFFCKVGDTADYLIEKYGLSSVTTTSPLIAKFFKQNFPQIEVRASVNMEIGTPEGMDYIAEYFDGFYLKREYNRNFEKITVAKVWCRKNFKKLYGLANSGCLNFCSAHIFHDNLVSHENEIAQMDNAYQFEGICWDYLKGSESRENWLKITNFIRPEDTKLYEGLFDGIKLATRVNANPARIINAYCKGTYSGAVTELLEPNHSGIFYPKVIENKKIPETFGEKVLKCNKNCDECGFCHQVQETATVVLE